MVYNYVKAGAVPLLSHRSTTSTCKCKRLNQIDVGNEPPLYRYRDINVLCSHLILQKISKGLLVYIKFHSHTEIWLVFGGLLYVT